MLLLALPVSAASAAAQSLLHQVMGCALLLPLGVSPDGQRVAEIGAFCVDVVFRGTGRGDSLLDYVEQVGVFEVQDDAASCCLRQQRVA